MADLAQSAVTINRAWTEGGLTGKAWRCLDVTLVLTAQGTAANKIPFSVLGLEQFILESGPFIITANGKLVPSAPDATGANLLLYSLVNATDANRNDPADITATVRGVVKGF